MAATTPDQKALNFFITCFLFTNTPDWKQVAVVNGISGTATMSAAKLTQRKFKKLVEASGIYALDNGKVILKDGPSEPGARKPGNQSALATPTTPSSSKKRGRPCANGSVKSSFKKPKKSPLKEPEEDVEEEASDEPDRDNSDAGQGEERKELDV